MLNWAGSYAFQADRIERPTTTEQVAVLVAGATKVRAVGTRHCFTDIADSPGGLLISTEHLNDFRHLDAEKRQVTVGAGITYGKLNPILQMAGFALANLASLPHVSVAGATATATHGSGEKNACLSANVAGLKLVTADGAVRTIRRGDADFDGAVVHVGGLGIVTEITLDLVPAFDVEQHVYRNVPRAALLKHYDELLASAYSVSTFTHWQSENVEQVWIKARAGVPHFDLRKLGGVYATAPAHPIENIPGMADFVGYDPIAATQQGGVPGPSFERLTHFRLEHTPSAGEELQSEYFVPRQHAAAAYEAVATLRDAMRPVIQICEWRAIAADSLWLSPFYERPSVGIHFTWRRDWDGVRAVTAKLEAVLAPFCPRPHWGKVFTLSAEQVRACYPRMNDYLGLRRRCDPNGKFVNAFATRLGLLD